MAGLFAVFGPPQRERVAAAADRLRFSVEESREIIALDGVSFAWTSFDDPALFGPAHDPSTGVRIVTAGRVSWEEEDWKRAERLTQFEGGLSCRLLLEAYLERGADALDRPDGPACILAWDPRSQEVHLTTDSMGYHPVFVYKPHTVQTCVICTHPDALADDPEVETTPDLISYAEFLSKWQTTAPTTYYTEIEYAKPGHHWRWNVSEGISTDWVSWEPFQEAPYRSLEAGADELAEALFGAIRRRTLGRLGKTVVYTSGGMDSRAILFGAADDAQLVGVNMYEHFNHEAAIAKQICDASGTQYLGFARDYDYYPRWISEGSRWSGGMWSTEDNHFIGTWDAVRSLGATTVTTGCTADRVFKGWTLERRYKTLFGRNLPLQVLDPTRATDYRPNRASPLPPQLATAVQDRYEARFEGLPTTYTKDRDWLLAEDRRVRPNAYGASVSGPIMYRIFPYDTFLADRAVADAYSRTKAEWKVNADLWGRAVARVAGDSRDIPLAHAGWRSDSPTAVKVALFAKGWVQRRLPAARKRAAAKPNGPATDGSWPQISWYLQNSSSLRDLFERATPEDRDLIRTVYARDPWKTPPWGGGWSANEAFRVATLLARFQNRREDLQSDIGGPAGGSVLSPRPETSPMYDHDHIETAPSLTSTA